MTRISIPFYISIIRDWKCVVNVQRYRIGTGVRACSKSPRLIKKFQLGTKIIDKKTTSRFRLQSRRTCSRKLRKLLWEGDSKWAGGNLSYCPGCRIYRFYQLADYSLQTRGRIHGIISDCCAPFWLEGKGRWFFCCLELTVWERSDKVAPIKKECALSTKRAHS